MASECPNYLVTCNLVWEHDSFPLDGTCAWNEILAGLGVERRASKHGTTSVCRVTGSFDLCPVQMGRHASWVHRANATVTNDSGADPMPGTSSRTNKRPDEWASVSAASVSDEERQRATGNPNQHILLPSSTSPDARI